LSSRPPQHDPPDGVNVADLDRAGLEREVQRLRGQLALSQRKLEGIQEIGQILATDRDPDRVLGQIIRRTTTLMGAERATLYLLSTEDETRMVSKSTHGGEIRTIELDIGQGLAGWVARHRRSVNVKDAYKDPRFDPSTDRESGFRTRSILCYPLEDMRGQILGVIQVLNKTDGYFTTADEALLHAIAGQAAVCIRNSRLFLDIVTKNISLLDTQLRLRERNQEIELLFRIERAAARAITQDEALDSILEAVAEDFNCRASAVLIHDEARGCLLVANVHGEASSWLIPGQRVALDGTVAGEVFFAGQARTLTAGDLTRVGLGVPPDLTFDHGLCLPLARPEGTLGCLLFLDPVRELTTFSDRDVQLLSMIGTRMALSIVLARTLEEERKAERLAAIGKTLSGVVHDLRTPLTIIGGYARLLAREDDAETRAAHRELIKKQIDAIQAMIREILAFARGDTQALLRKTFVKDFLTEVAEMLREELAGSGVELVVEATYRGAVRMDAPKMLRAVFNLARNAREAMSGDGGVFRVSVTEQGGMVALSFTDTGPGIPPEMEGRLFDSFATFGKSNGTGLGLAIVKKIVDEHQGTLSVSSGPGAGTTFTIALPAL